MHLRPEKKQRHGCIVFLKPHSKTREAEDHPPLAHFFHQQATNGRPVGQGHLLGSCLLSPQDEDKRSTAPSTREASLEQRQQRAGEGAKVFLGFSFSADLGDGQVWYPLISSMVFLTVRFGSIGSYLSPSCTSPRSKDTQLCLLPCRVGVLVEVKAWRRHSAHLCRLLAPAEGWQLG